MRTPSKQAPFARTWSANARSKSRVSITLVVDDGEWMSAIISARDARALLQSLVESVQAPYHLIVASPCGIWSVTVHKHEFPQLRSQIRAALRAVKAPKTTAKRRGV